MAADEPRPARPRRTTAEPPPQAVMGLLNYLTATSLDEDYAHVSLRRAATGPRRRGNPGVVGLVVLAVFGVLVATAAVRTERTADESASSHRSLVAQVVERRATLGDERRSISRLQARIAALQTRDSTLTVDGEQVTRQLTRLGVSAGTVSTRGPGVQVLVDDAPGATSFRQQVQAPDLQKLVNGLWQVGAEAVSINGQRLTSLTSIRDAASAITVNYVSLSRPYTVSAIGNPKTMGAALLGTAAGQAWATLQSTFGLKFAVDTKDSMLLPAAQHVSLRSAHEPDGRS